MPVLVHNVMNVMDERPREVRLPREKLVENVREERACPLAARDHGQDRDVATDLDRGVS